MIKKKLVLAFAVLGVFALASQVKASQVSLADWCVDLNGDINTACNGAGSGGPSGIGNINLGAFDTTLSPGNNTLGMIVVTLGSSAVSQYVAFYADYDVDFATQGSFADTGAVHGVLPTGASYELDDPNTSNIFTDFSTNALSNANNVGTPSGAPNQCCDVSFALGLNLLAPNGGTATFAVTSTAPTSGFYIEQTNEYTDDSIFLQETTSLNPPSGGGGVTPEPSSFILGLSLISGVVAFKRRRAV